MLHHRNDNKAVGKLNQFVYYFCSVYTLLDTDEYSYEVGNPLEMHFP